MNSRAVNAICRRLLSTGVYTQFEQGLLGAQLAAYDAAFAALEQKLLLVQQELFIATASADGLDLWEQAVRAVPAQVQAQQRRAMLLARAGIGQNDDTAVLLTQKLPALGIEGTVYEETDNVHVGVRALYGITQQEALRQLALLLPAHLPFTADFTPWFWQLLDNADLTAAQWDALDLTFDAFDQCEATLAAEQ